MRERATVDAGDGPWQDRFMRKQLQPVFAMVIGTWIGMALGMDGFEAVFVAGCSIAGCIWYANRVKGLPSS